MRSDRTEGGSQLPLFSSVSFSETPALPLDAASQEPRAGGTRVRITCADSKSILTPASGFIRGYKFTLNPYGGCGFGCEYCYARFFAPSREEQSDWGAWVRVKQNAVEALRRAQRARTTGRRLETDDKLYMATVTDPYQPIEARQQLTRRILEELLPVQPRLTIQTRSPIVTRDIDLLRQFQHVRVNFTITTDNERIRLRYEPHCPSIRVRLRAAEALVGAGVQIGISISPMLPIGDPEAFGLTIARLDASEYVTQYLKPVRARFTAGSTVEAQQKLHEDGWTKERYREVREILKRVLGPTRPLLEDDAGYGPPP